jgi:hypothetical protein
MPSPVWSDDSFEFVSGELSDSAATDLLDHDDIITGLCFLVLGFWSWVLGLGFLGFAYLKFEISNLKSKNPKPRTKTEARRPKTETPIFAHLRFVCYRFKIMRLELV